MRAILCFFFMATILNSGLVAVDKKEEMIDAMKSVG